MTSNANFTSGGVSYASRGKRMAAYDRLPKSVRNALADAAFDWAPYPIRQRFERGVYTAKAIVNLIGSWDAQQIARDRKRVWGIGDSTNKAQRSAP